jgi:hypothetical protein
MGIDGGADPSTLVLCCVVPAADRFTQWSRATGGRLTHARLCGRHPPRSGRAMRASRTITTGRRTSLCVPYPLLHRVRAAADAHACRSTMRTRRRVRAGMGAPSARRALAGTRTTRPRSRPRRALAPRCPCRRERGRRTLPEGSTQVLARVSLWSTSIACVLSHVSCACLIMVDATVWEACCLWRVSA